MPRGILEETICLILGNEHRMHSPLIKECVVSQLFALYQSLHPVAGVNKGFYAVFCRLPGFCGFSGHSESIFLAL